MKVVFTNGCFDILHPGHISLLRMAKRYGDKLIVGLNTDNSIRQIKGIYRPINTLEFRKAVLEGVRYVDEVLPFDEITPYNLIKEIQPDVLVKGGDWPVEKIVGHDIVPQTFSIPLLYGYSTTKIIDHIRSL